MLDLGPHEFEHYSTCPVIQSLPRHGAKCTGHCPTLCMCHSRTQIATSGELVPTLRLEHYTAMNTNEALTLSTGPSPAAKVMVHGTS